MLANRLAAMERESVSRFDAIASAVEKATKERAQRMDKARDPSVLLAPELQLCARRRSAMETASDLVTRPAALLLQLVEKIAVLETKSGGATTTPTPP